MISAVQVLIQRDFGLSDTQLGTLGAAFILVYMLAAPAIGLMADRWPRQYFISGGVALWSLATAGSAMARNFWQLLLMRGAVGIGEAGYATVSPSLLSDLFPRSTRGRAMSVFYTAIPVGSALGIVLGGYLGQHYGWRNAFLMVGLPGLIAAVAALWLPDPPRGASDSQDGDDPGDRPALVDYVRLLKIRSYLVNTAGMTCYSFCLGGLIHWMPTFLVRVRDLDLAEATTWFGLITVAAGFLGTATGGWLGDWLQERTPGGYFLMSGIALGIGLPFAVLAIILTNTSAAWVCLFLGEFFFFLNTGPLNAALANVVPASMRATGFALNIFIIHLLGDVASPPLIGALSDTFDLKFAILVCFVPMAFASAFYLYGMQFYGVDVARAARSGCGNLGANKS